MNDLIDSLTSTLSKLKNACVEQLWIIGLIAPIVIIACICLIKLDKPSSNSVVISTEIKQVEKQLSDAEVAAVVELPMDELVKMPVYSDEPATDAVADASGYQKAAIESTKTVIDKKLFEQLKTTNNLSNKLAAQAKNKRNSLLQQTIPLANSEII